MNEKELRQTIELLLVRGYFEWMRDNADSNPIAFALWELLNLIADLFPAR